MHFIDEGPKDAEEVVLMLHGLVPQDNTEAIDNENFTRSESDPSIRNQKVGLSQRRAHIDSSCKVLLVFLLIVTDRLPFSGRVDWC